jgi:hyperosmotically inducible periplasmic protein
MKKIIVLIATAAFSSVALFGAGCAVLRDQETVGAYVDDTTITTRVKARFVEDATVDASAISVETLKGTVQLSGFAKSTAEKSKAESIARGVKGVVAVQNAIAVRS